MPWRPYLIGIAGGSCAGKSELATHLSSCLSGTPASIVSLDAYYHDLAALAPEDRAHWNFDHPDALDWVLLSSDLELLAGGHPIDAPVYDFTSHTRSAQRRRVPTSEFVIVEGLLALYREEVRRLLDLTVYVRTDEATRLARRLARDTHERGRSVESVMAQWHATVCPMFERFVEPTCRLAHAAVNGADPPERSSALVREYLRGRWTQVWSRGRTPVY